jgi:hypothetical protein
MDALLSPTGSSIPLSKNVDSSAQLTSGKKTVSFGDLPFELVRQILSEAVADASPVFSTGKWRPSPNSRRSITSLLLICKRLSQEVSEQMYESLHLRINGDDLDLDTGQWQNQKILGYWDFKMRTTPWKSFRKVKVSLIPSLYKNGTRIWNLSNLFEISQVVAPKLQLELWDRVQAGRCKVEVVCCEIDGNHISHYNNSATVEELPLPCWTFFQLGLVLETWGWLHWPDGHCYSTLIHMPNVILPLCGTDAQPRVLEFWIKWLSEVWEMPKSLPMADRVVSQREFTRKQTRKYGFVSVSNSSNDRWILVEGLQVKDASSERTKFTHTKDITIENQLGAYRVKADHLLKQIRHHAVDLPAPMTYRPDKYLQLAQDLRTKAHRPGMVDITGRLKGCLQEAETFHESRWSPIGSGHEALQASREADEVA